MILVKCQTALSQRWKWNRRNALGGYHQHKELVLKIKKCEFSIIDINNEKKSGPKGTPEDAWHGEERELERE